MTTRAVVRHVRYWRGQVHRWSTVYQFVGTPSSGLTAADAQTVFAADSKMLYNAGAPNGGAYECDLYNQASGGVPIASYTAFNWEVPANWAAPINSVWTTTSGSDIGVPAEAALLVEWAAGLSKSGKPVKLRKWYHQVKVASSQTGAGPDIVAADITALQTQAQAIVGCLGAKGLTLGSSTGRLAGTATVSQFYNNHQMSRGRRRKALVNANGVYKGPNLTFPGPQSSDEGGDVPA